MPTIPHLCSRVQNGFRARLRHISIPESKINLSVARILYKQGFIASIARGNTRQKDIEPTPTTNLNIATRRYWLELKYSEHEPVLRQFKCVSKPSRKVTINVAQLMQVRAGRQVGLVKPLLPGEVLILSTPQGVMDLQEAIDARLGGHVLARIV